MLKALSKVQLAAFASFFTGSGRNKKGSSKGKKIAFSLLMIYALGALVFLFWHVFDTLAMPFQALEIGWVYFDLAAIMAFALMFIGSVFTAKAQLFEAKDNDLLLSLPIRPGTILMSRTLLLLVLNFVLGLIVLAPAAAVWFTCTGVMPVSLICTAAVAVLLPFFATAVAALFAYLLSVLMGKVRRKSIFATVFSLAFMGAYFVFVGKMETYIMNLAASGEAIAEKFSLLRPLVWIGSAMAEGKMMELLLTALIMLLPFGAAYLLLSRSFLRLTTAHYGVRRVEYVERSEKIRTPDAALLGRELKRFFSSTAYLLNAGLGAFMMLLAAVMLIIKRDMLTELLSMLRAEGLPIEAYLAPGAALAACLLSGMTMITACSISIEGHSLDILKSLPVSAEKILGVKVRMHLIIALPPMVILLAVLAWVLGLGGVATIQLFVLPIAFAILIALAGLALDLKMPRLDWTNETQAVKQSMSALICIFGSWGVIALPVAAVFLLKLAADEITLLVWGYFAVLVLACVLLWIWIRKRGTRIFRTI